jgi:7-cyano-7-deazaguanine synthase
MKAVVVLSGGMDSATVLAKAVTEYGAAKISTITFNYNSKHNFRENDAALFLSDHYKVPNKLVHLPFINELFKSDLLSSGGEIPEGHYAAENMKKTVVPFRNGIMLAIAVGYAESIKAKGVLIGNHAGDHTIYPDCRATFMESFGEAVNYGTWDQLELIRPFENMSKGDIVKMGTNLSVPYHLTWSCYKGGKNHCGKCGTCVERREAFEIAGVPDPVIFDDPEFYRSVLKDAAASP